MIGLRIYLLLGMLAHKALWEAMKRRQPGRGSPPTSRVPRKVLLAKVIKLLVLLAILVQTVWPADVLPLTVDPVLWRVTGALLYTLGLVTAMLGRIQLGENWSDIEVAAIQKEHRAVTRGVYRFVRHPIYVGDLLLLLGLELALNSWLIVLAVLLVPPVLARAVREEAGLRTRLAGYDEYARRTARFVPYLF